MQAVYYYPTKLTITQGGNENDDLEDLYERKWRAKSKRLQARRWRKVHDMERMERESQ